MSDPLARAARDGARQLRRMPRELRREMTRHVRDEVATPAAGYLRASYVGPWSARLAAGTKARVQGDPTVAVGGARPVVSGGASVRQLVYGEQFGGGSRRTAVAASSRRKGYALRSTRQFAARGSNTIYRTFGARAGELFDRWLAALDPYLDRWEDS